MKIHGPQSPWRVRLPAGDARRLRRVAAAAGLAPEQALRLAIVSELPGLEGTGQTHENTHHKFY